MPGRKRTYATSFGYRTGYGRSTRPVRKRAFRMPRRLGAPGTVLSTRGFRGSYGSSKNERKVSDVDNGTYQVNTTGNFTLLHIPTLGTDFTNRIGRKTVVKSIFVRGRVQLEIDAALTAAVVNSQGARMILFVDLQPNGVVPATTDILKEATFASQINLNNRDRFKILADKNFAFGPFVRVDTATQAILAFNDQIKIFKKYKKCTIETIFNSTNGGTIADITSGAIYMFWIGSAASGTNTDTNAIVTTRCRFVDS